MTTFFEAQNELLESGAAFVAVTVVDTLGSTPQDRGAKMLVTENGRHFGTVGGGKIEVRCIDEALGLLRDADAPPTRFVQWSLEKDIGMTCGGIVRVYFESFNAPRWNIVVFGAGHVASALIELMLRLDCRITCIDPREEWLSRLPSSTKLTKVLTSDMPAEVAKIRDGSFVLLMTMGHTTDRPILIEILRTRTFPYLGVIGSNAKAKRLRQDVRDAGLPDEAQRAFFCPVGLELGSNHPQEIAISVAAQMLQLRDAR
ncbi:MAG: xanthine dehydrogenase accessory protein XdhC [Acidobacteria bacterium]|nr:xanthine dehydrogenase accessory protein XdhC [Acidobacteriota bacterium]MBV9477173.1 xanthine dehydrogenase accessory protein XdhC [Acidobacteriota bacterium]